jgi:ferrous iron transport protein B
MPVKAHETAASCHATPAPLRTTDAPIVLVGNPNVGKSVIFGRLTGRYVTVSNYPGTTVEITQGSMPDGTPVIDTPGINSLYSASDDERVTHDLLVTLRDKVGAVVQVADGKNLQRALLLTQQLVDLEIPLVLVINMIDEAQIAGIEIDFDALARKLGIEVVPVTAIRGEGIKHLTEALTRARVAHHVTVYDPFLEDSIARVMDLLPADVGGGRGIALQLLSGNQHLAQTYQLNGELTAINSETSKIYGRPLKTVFTGLQMANAAALMNDIVRIPEERRHSLAHRVSAWATHPLWGWPVLMVVLYVVFKFVGEFGAVTLVGFFEETLFGEWINPFATQIVEGVIPFAIVRDLLVGEYGMITMALSYGLGLIFPIVTTFFIAFSVLEDSGYLPRLAVMLNRAFKSMGLNGKAVLPMILGLGCDTMATMSTRIMETRKERIMVTLLLALGVPCSAQLGVLLGMVTALTPFGVFIWAAVIVSVMLAVGWLAQRIIPGQRSDFILELPPIRLPHVSNIIIKTLARVEWYLKEVVPLFILSTLILFILDRIGALVVIEDLMSPLVVGLLGLPAAAAGAFLIGFLRRDYGATMLFGMALGGHLDAGQVLVSMVVITLFVPCIANVLMIFKEFGWRVATGVIFTVFPIAFAAGALVNALLGLFRFAL